MLIKDSKARTSMGFNLEDCYNKMNKGEVILSYKGSITADLITNVLGLIELKLEDSDEKPNIKKRIYNVLVEILQNLFHHVDDPDFSVEEYGNNFGVFVISKVVDGFQVSTGNFIKSERRQFIQNRLDKINSLTKEELKEFYKFVLNNQKFSDKGGGGLGLIDMAKRTSKKLDYTFYPYNGKFEFFSLSVHILNN